MMLTEALAVIVSFPEPVTTFSMLQSVSLPDWLLGCTASAHEAASEVDRQVGGYRRHIQRVAAGIAIVDVIAVAGLGDEHIVAAAAMGRVVAGTGLDHVVALIAEDAVGSRITVEHVVSSAAHKVVVAGAAEDHVVAGLSTEEIVTVIAAHDVAAGTAGRHVIAGECDDHFSACRAEEHIGGGSAGDRGSRCCSGAGGVGGSGAGVSSSPVDRRR